LNGWGRGVSAGLAGLGAAETVAAATRSRSLLDAAGQVVIDLGPLPVVELTVQLLKAADKPVIRATVAATVLGAGALLGQAPRRVGRDVLSVAAAATAGAVLSRQRSEAEAGGSDKASNTGLAAGTGALMALGVLTAPAPAVVPAALAGTVGLAAALVGQSRRRLRLNRESARRVLQSERPLPPAVDGAEGWPGVSPLHTPIQDFYVTDVNMRPPVVDLRRWRLAVTGAVGNPLVLSYDDLLALGLVEFDAAMVCIHNRLGWNRIGNTRWTGVPLHRVLSTAQAEPQESFLVTRAVDGFESSMPLRLLDGLDGYVAVGMAGRALTAAHGFPARVFIPGVYGQYTGAKWLTELRLQTKPNRDYWLPRGWARGPVRVRPLSRIDAPVDRARVPVGQTDIVGVAWAPPAGVTEVHVAVDDQPWTSAELATELAPAAWRRWRTQVTLTAGQHQLRVRCIAQDGSLQDAERRPPFPSGATGHHTSSVTAS